jgi:hypothetical protein
MQKIFKKMLPVTGDKKKCPKIILRLKLYFKRAGS